MILNKSQNLKTLLRLIWFGKNLVKSFCKDLTIASYFENPHIISEKEV